VTRHVYVDEIKSGGYVLAAVTVADPVAERKVIRGLVQPGNRRLHMVDERPRRRPGIVSALVATDIEVAIYDAARRYRTGLAARKACLTALVEDLAGGGAADTRLVLEQDDSLVASDRRQLYQLVRRAGLTTVEYYHQRGHEEALLALPDLAAWCWVRSEQWRRRIAPVLVAVRTV
jgi:hypothetical protein